MSLPMAVTGELEFKNEKKSMDTEWSKELRSYKGTKKRMILCSCAFTGQMSKITGASEEKVIYAMQSVQYLEQLGSALSGSI